MHHLWIFWIFAKMWSPRDRRDRFRHVRTSPESTGGWWITSSCHKAFISPGSVYGKIIKQTIPIIRFPVNHQPPPKKVPTEQPLDAIQNPHHFTTQPPLHEAQVSWLCNFTRSALYLVRALAASSSAKARWVRISWRSRVICTGGVCHPAMGLGKAWNKNGNNPTNMGELSQKGRIPIHTK